MKIVFCDKKPFTRVTDQPRGARQALEVGRQAFYRGTLSN